MVYNRFRIENKGTAAQFQLVKRAVKFFVI